MREILESTMNIATSENYGGAHTSATPVQGLAHINSNIYSIDPGPIQNDFFLKEGTHL